MNTPPTNFEPLPARAGSGGKCRWCGSREIPWQGLQCDRKTQGECGSFGSYQSAVCQERAKANRWIKMLELLVSSYEVDQHCMDNDSNDDLETRMTEARAALDAHQNTELSQPEGAHD